MMRSLTQSFSFSRWSAGNHLVDPTGNVTTLHYNARQLASIDFPTFTQTVEYDSNNRIDTVTNSDGTTAATYTYDAVDRVTSVTTDFGPFSKSYSYTYYDNGWIRTYTNPEGITYSYTYHADGTLAAVNIPGEGQITLADYQWLAPRTMTLPGGTTIASNYDALLRLDCYTVTDPAGQTIASGQYGYDAVNNILSILTEADDKQYGYDDLYRLTSADVTQLEDETYTYDGVGNRLSSAQEPVWTYNDKNQLISHGTTTYEYDANGNRIKKTEDGVDTHYVYNTEERLIRVEDHDHNPIGEYYYDPFGLRLYNDVAGARTYFLYNGEGLAAEYDATGNLIAEYHYGPNKPWMTDPLFQRRNSAVYYYQTDHLGTPQKLITKSGQVVWQGRYEAFGAVTETINTVDNPLRFPGQFEDDELGISSNAFRLYSSHLGRYLETDPIGLQGGLNRYAYSFLNPVANSDPVGLDATVSYDSEAAAGEGHLGISVNYPHTVGRYPTPEASRADIVLGKDVPGEIRGDDPDETDASLIIPLSPQQDAAVIACVRAAARGDRTYNLYSNSCVDLVRDCLRAAGGVSISDSIRPRDTFCNLVEQEDIQCTGPGCEECE